MSEALADLDYDGILVDKPDAGAILVAFVDGEREEWLPRTLIMDHDEEAHIITVPQWWAEDRELV